MVRFENPFKRPWMTIVLKGMLVDDAITDVKFACDLSRCKGACCTIPGHRGAPLLDEEVEEVEKAYPIVRRYLSYRHRDTIEERTMFQGRPGDYTTQVVDRQACVFVIFEEGIAKCAFEKAYLNNEIGWRKPISCHLFPIRVDRGLPMRLRYEQIQVCQPAMELGQQQGISLSEFLRTALLRAFGDTWYDEFLDYCQRKRSQTTT